MTDELPPGWALTDIGTLGRYVNGRGFGKDEWKKVGLPIIRIQNLNDESAEFNYSDKEHESKYRVNDGDLLVAWAASLGVYYWNRGPAWLNQHIFRVEIEERAVIKPFLYYTLKHALEGLYKKAHGSGMVHVTKGKFDSHPVKLPPLNEQQRIVSKIDELFSRIDEGERALERVQRLVERYRQSVLKAAVTGELTRDWREKNKHRHESGEALLARILKARRDAWEKAELDKMKAKGIMPANDKWKQKYEEPVAPDVVGLPTLPTGWVYVNIDVLVAPVAGSIRRGPFGSTLTKSIFVSSGYKVYEQQHAIGGDFTAGRYYIDEEKYQELSSFWLKPGDLIISCSGTVGRIATVPDDAEPGVMNQALLKLTLAPTVMNAEFFKLAFLHRLASFSSRGSGMNNFSGIEELKKMPFPLPPLDEQREVLQQADRQFSVTDHQELELGRQQRMVGSLRQAVLREGFRGVLVRQESTDEPASALLQRIATERADAPAKPKRGRKPKTSEPV